MLTARSGQQELASSFSVVIFSVIPFVCFFCPSLFLVVLLMLQQPDTAMQCAMLSEQMVSDEE